MDHHWNPRRATSPTRRQDQSLNDGRPSSHTPSTAPRSPINPRSNFPVSPRRGNEHGSYNSRPETQLVPAGFPISPRIQNMSLNDGPSSYSSSYNGSPNSGLRRQNNFRTHQPPSSPNTTSSSDHNTSSPTGNARRQTNGNNWNSKSASPTQPGICPIRLQRHTDFHPQLFSQTSPGAGVTRSRPISNTAHTSYAPPTSRPEFTQSSTAHYFNNHNSSPGQNHRNSPGQAHRPPVPTLPKPQKFSTGRTKSEGSNAHASILYDLLAGRITLEHAPESLKLDKTVVMVAVRKNYESFPYVHSSLKKDLDVVLAALEGNKDGWKTLYYIPECHHDKQFMLACVKKNPSAMNYVSGPLKSDRDVVIAAASQNCKVLEHASRSIRGDKQLMLSLIKKDPAALEYAIPSLQNDPDLIRAISDGGERLKLDNIKAGKLDILADAVVDGESLKNAPEELKGDRKFVLSAIKQHGLALKHASPNLRCDKSFLLEAVTENHEVFGCVPEDIKCDKSFVLTALMITGKVYEWIPHELKRDKKITLLAVQQYWEALKHAKDLCGDRDVVMAALVQNVEALKFANQSLSRDKAFILAAVRERGDVFKFACDELQGDREIAVAAVVSNGSLLQHASPALKADKQVVIRAVTKTGYALRYADNKLQSDKAVCLAAVNQNGSALRYCSKDIKGDKQIALAAVTQKGNALEHVSPALKSDKTVVLAAVMETGFAFRYAAKELKSDREIVFAAVDNDGTILKHAPDHLKGDKTIVLRAIDQTASAFEFADETMRGDKDVVCAAVAKNSDLLKLALNGLNQDRDCWIAAGLWKEEENHNDIPEHLVRIVLSTRFSLQEHSKSTVTEFTRRLGENPYFNDGMFYIYSPNAFNQSTCDKDWTRMDWPCRGTYGTCRKEPPLKTGKPTFECCWRYSFRWHLEEARRTNGFMLQIVDLCEKDGKKEYQLGDGQKIETVMANQVGTKIFRIFRPRATNVHNNRQLFTEFRSDHINMLQVYVQDWYGRSSVDMDECEIHIDEEW